MQLGAKDGSGRPRPEPIKDSCFALETDTIIMALGSEIEPPPIAGVETEGTLVKVDENQQTPARNILAGGDLTSNARFVSEALGAGKKAADQIDRLLGGLSDIAETALLKSEPLPYSQINSFYFPQNPAATNSRLDPAERLKSFKEVQLGITEKEAFYETSRCFNCGQCISCDNCFYYCPDMAIRINNTNEQKEGPYTILEQYCKGCGLCVKECPRGAIVLEEESK
jgi:Pyruvate/2-oxoacid:ferredoxin oxidoreductase delta subunit